MLYELALDLENGCLLLSDERMDRLFLNAFVKLEVLDVFFFLCSGEVWMRIQPFCNLDDFFWN
jgi:hypothetical protein